MFQSRKVKFICMLIAIVQFCDTEFFGTYKHVNNV